MPQLRSGTARADITPDWPITLAGFASRTHPSEGVSQPLHVRVAVIETGPADRVVVICADLLWWGPEHLATLRPRIAELAKVPGAHILFSATHTHSGPQTALRAHSGIGVVDPRYLDLLTERTVAATRAAIADLEPVTVTRHTGSHDLGFNRRPQFDPDGPTDPTLTVVRFARADGSAKALFAHFTCHPVITNEHLVSGEWPGVAMTTLEADLDLTAFYLQGCCADINPVHPGKRESLRGTNLEVKREGARFADAVRAVMRQPGEPLEPVPPRATIETVHLPFAALPTDADLQPGADDPPEREEWRLAMLAHPEWRTATLPLQVQRVDIADGLALLAMDGEIAVSYGLHIRNRSHGNVLPMGYANGMTGYIPTAKLIAEGGYEGGDAIPWFLLPAPFDPSVEAILTEAIDRLLDRP